MRNNPVGTRGKKRGSEGKYRFGYKRIAEWGFVSCGDLRLSIVRWWKLNTII